MGIGGSVVVLMCAWWMVFFIVLPWGIRSQWEDGDVIEGNDPGAPVEHHLGKKALIASVVAVIIWLVSWTIVTFDLISIDRSPWQIGTPTATEGDE